MPWRVDAPEEAKSAVADGFYAAMLVDKGAVSAD